MSDREYEKREHEKRKRWRRERELDAQWARLRRVLLAAGTGGGEPVKVHCGTTPGQIELLWGLVCGKVDQTIIAMFDEEAA